MVYLQSSNKTWRGKHLNCPGVTLGPGKVKPHGENNLLVWNHFLNHHFFSNNQYNIAFEKFEQQIGCLESLHVK